MSQQTVTRGARRLLCGLEETDIQDILAARRRRVSFAKLGRIYGYHPTAIRYAVQQLDAELVEETAPKGPLFALDERVRAAIVAARRDGATYNALARQYGYAANTIRHAVRLIVPDVYLETKRQ